MRHDNGTKLEYSDIVPGMDIEHWWPYEDKGNTPRYRKCRVIRCTVVDDPNHTESSPKPADYLTIAKRELGISDAILERFDFDAQLKDILLDVTEEEEGEQGDKRTRNNPRMKKLNELRKRRDELAKMYNERRKRHEKLEQLYPQFLNPINK
jgi:hypothetical protein